MTMRVTVCGPNLTDQSKGDFHVHAEGCGDLRRGAAGREPEYANGWTIEAETREAIIRSIYEDQIAEQEGERAYFREHPAELDALGYPESYKARINDPVDWRDYDDIYIFDCCKAVDR